VISILLEKSVNQEKRAGYVRRKSAFANRKSTLSQSLLKSGQLFDFRFAILDWVSPFFTDFLEAVMIATSSLVSFSKGSTIMFLIRGKRMIEY
jgi:hypothetical protein